MGKPLRSLVNCDGCGKSVYKINANINLAKKLKRRMYCSSACCGVHNRSSHIEKLCSECGILFVCSSIQKANKTCSKHCGNRRAGRLQNAAKYEKFIAQWKNGNTASIVSKHGKVSGYIRTYLFNRAQNKCEKCGWSHIHPVTGKIPLQVDHIDGDWSNNAESNLQLLCPNCHVLTPTYGSLNRGKGRPFKYLPRKMNVTG